MSEALSATLLSPSIFVASSHATDTFPAEPVPDGLAARLAKRDPNELRNKIFNFPPSAQTYPEWMVGEWTVHSSFNGYLFPSTKVDRQRLLADYSVPGFQKCSIAATADVGRESVSYRFRVLNNGREDRVCTLQSSIDAFLGHAAVNEVLYDASANPNRISVDFVDYKTINAERIELFCNARESQVYQQNGCNIFVCSEYFRQVTFGTGQVVGVPRQVTTNYALYWTWKQAQQYGNRKLDGNLLIAGFLDPQDALYFEEPTLPVVIYSHVLSAKLV
jgi:hypothetical protein